MNFLPDDYQSPASSNNFMKIQDGENKIRILSAPIFGWEDWDNNKPVRYRMNKKPNVSLSPQRPIRHFWSMIIWDYVESKVKILHICQAAIRKGIETLSKDKDYGEPFGYDIKITKSGSGKDTTYTVMPMPPKPLDAHIANARDERPFNLEALFSNGDPFAPEWNTEDKTNKNKLIDDNQFEQISDLIGHDSAFVEKIYSTLRIKSLSEIPAAEYERVKKRCLERIREVPDF